MKWYVRTGKNIDIIVEAKDQWEAFDFLLPYEPREFGLISEAQPTNETEEGSFAVRTSVLFGRWGMPEIAAAFIRSAMAVGLPDTSETDILE